MIIWIFVFVLLSGHLAKEISTRHQFRRYAKQSTMRDYYSNKERTKTNHLIVNYEEHRSAVNGFIKKLKGVKICQIYKGNAYLTFMSYREAQEAYEMLGKKKSVTVYQDAIVLAQENSDLNAGVTRETKISSSDTVQNTKGGTKVAVIDTGVNGAGECVDLTGEGARDENGHGTRLAQIIQEESGNKADILSIKALNKNGYGSVACLTAAVEYAIDQHVKIIHMSVVAGYKVQAKPLEKAIQKATKKGILVVASAGNQGIDVKHIVPANMKEAIVVSAVDETGSFAGYSNYGETIDYSAVGTYGQVFGTSYAAAVITGKLLQYKEKELNLHSVDLGKRGWDPYYGKGTFGVEQIQTDEGRIPSDHYADMLFDTDRWKKLTDEELNEGIRWHSDQMVAIWFQSLSKREQSRLLKRDTWLVSEYEDLTTHEKMKYYQWLLKQDINEVSIADWNNTAGYFNIRVTGDGKESSLKVSIKIAGKDVETSQKVTFTGISGTNLHEVSVGAGINTSDGIVTTMQHASVTKKADSDGTSGKNSNGETIYRSANYQIMVGKISFKKPAYYYATFSSNPKTSAGKDTTTTNSRVNTKKYNWQNTGASTWIGMNGESYDEEKNFNLQAHGWRIGLSSTECANPTYELINIQLKPAKLNVEFLPNGGEGNSFEKLYSFTEKVDEGEGLPNVEDFFQREGYHVEKDKAWVLESEQEKQFDEDDANLMTKDLTEIESQEKESQRIRLKANWKPNTYEIQYDSNGGEGNMSPTKGIYDQKIALREECFQAPEEKVFAGWNTKKDGSGTTYGDMEEVENLVTQQEGSITLYAQWEDGSLSWNERFSDGPEVPEYPKPEILEYYYPLHQRIQLHKVDETDIPIQGVKFEITCNETGEVQGIVTDENGYGQVDFKEYLDITLLDQSFFYYSKEDWESMTNQQQEYVLQTKKHYKDYESAKAAAEPYFKKIAEANLHSYTIKEVEWPDYCQPTEEKAVTVKGENPLEIKIVNPTLVEPLSLKGKVTLIPKFQIRKTKSDGKNTIENVRLRICDGNNNILEEGDTDENGILEYSGDSVTVETKEYFYLDAEEELSETLQSICKEKGWYTSFDEAMKAYEQDENYNLVTCADGGKAREQLMTRTYYYKELESPKGYVQDEEYHTATVCWYTSSDVYDNLSIFPEDGDFSDVDDASEADENDNEDSFIEDEEDLNGMGTYGDPVDYAEILVNEEEPLMDSVEMEKPYLQNIELEKKGPKKELLSGAEFFVTSEDGEAGMMMESEPGHYIISFERIEEMTKGTYCYLLNASGMKESSVEAWISQAEEGTYRFASKEEAEAAAKEELDRRCALRKWNYEIEEVTPPPGYSLNQEKLELTVMEEAKVEVTDEYLGSVKIVKYKEKNGEKLEGVTFTLYVNKEPEKGTTTQSRPYKGETYYEKETLITDDEGEVFFENLEADENINYIIAEKDTEKDSSLLKDVIEVGSIPYHTDQKPSPDYKGYYLLDGDTYAYYDVVYHVVNHKVFAMPNTGKTHVYWFAYMSALCMFGAWWNVKNRRVGRRKAVRRKR